MAENLASCPDLSSGQDVVLPMSTPIKSSGHIQILYGNLAPEGSVAKITGKEGLKFTGQVRTTHTLTHSACLVLLLLPAEQGALSAWAQLRCMSLHHRLQLY